MTKKSTPLMVFTGVVLTTVCFAQTPHWEEEWYHGEGGDSPESATAVTDGNPESTTRVAAEEAAYDTAVVTADSMVEAFSEEESGETTDEVAAREVGGSGSALDIDVGVGSSTIGGVDVDYYTVRIPYSRKLSDRSTLQLSVPVSITNLEDVVADLSGGGGFSDAKVYGGGINAAWSYKPFIKADGKPYRWKITPSGGLFLRESSDLGQGAWVYNLGFSSSFAYRVAKKWVVNVGNSLSYSWNSQRKDYPEPMQDEQQILINGVQVFYLGGRWTYYGYVLDTRFLEDALIDNFQSYAMGAGFKLTQRRSLKMTVIYEDGDGYDSLRATLGTSWRF